MDDVHPLGEPLHQSADSRCDRCEPLHVHVGKCGLLSDKNMSIVSLLIHSDPLPFRPPTTLVQLPLSVPSDPT